MRFLQLHEHTKQMITSLSQTTVTCMFNEKDREKMALLTLALRR